MSQTEPVHFPGDDCAGFEASLAALAHAGDYKGLERLLRIRIHALATSSLERVGGRPKQEVELGLWRSLRALYVERLLDTERAIVVSELLVLQCMGDAEEHRILARLVANTNVKRAIAELEQSLVLEPHSVDSLRLLLHLHRRNEAWNEVHRVCAALEFHGALTAPERAHFLRVRRVTLGPSSYRITAEERRLLEAPVPTRTLDQLFFLAAPVVFRHLPDRGAESFLPLEPMFGQALRWAADMLGDQPPPLAERLCAGAARPLRDARLDTQCGQHTLGELVFIAGCQIAAGRTWGNNHRGLTRAGFSRRARGQLKLILFGLCWLADGPARVPAAFVEPAMAWARVFAQELSAYAKKEIPKLLGEVGGPFNLSQWVVWDAMTCARTGLLLVGDLAIANRVVHADATLAMPDHVAIMDDLCAFAATSVFARLSGRLQLAAMQIYRLPAPPTVSSLREPNIRRLDDVAQDALWPHGRRPLLERLFATLWPPILEGWRKRCDIDGRQSNLSTPFGELEPPKDRWAPFYQDAAAWADECLGKAASYPSKFPMGALAEQAFDEREGESSLREQLFLAGQRAHPDFGWRRLVRCFRQPGGLDRLLAEAVVVAGLAPRWSASGAGLPRHPEAPLELISPGQVDTLREDLLALRAAGETVDLEAFCRDEVLSRLRYALVLSGRTSVARAMLEREQVPTDPFPVEAKMRDLEAFAASATYRHLRGLLGFVEAG